jgi:hypothetical protein
VVKKLIIFLFLISGVLSLPACDASFSFGIGFGGPFCGTGYAGDFWAGDWDSYYGYGPICGPGFGLGFTVGNGDWYDDYYDDYAYQAPYYRPRAPWEDNIGKDYWYIINKTNGPIIVENNEACVDIAPRRKGKLSHRESFEFQVKLQNGRTQKIRSAQHKLIVNMGQDGKIDVK